MSFTMPYLRNKLTMKGCFRSNCKQTSWVWISERPNCSVRLTEPPNSDGSVSSAEPPNHGGSVNRTQTEPIFRFHHRIFVILLTIFFIWDLIRILKVFSWSKEGEGVNLFKRISISSPVSDPEVSVLRGQNSAGNPYFSCKAEFLHVIPWVPKSMIRLCNSNCTF